MKKVLVFLLVALVAVSGVFAVDISLGLGTGFEQEKISIPDGYLADFNKVPVTITSMFDFSDNFSLGANLGMLFCVDSSNNKTMLALHADLLAYHRFELTMDFNLYLGGGLRYVFSFPDWSDISMTTHGIAVLADLMVIYDVLDNLAVFASANFGTSIYKEVHFDGVSIDYSKYCKYLQLSAVVGAAYRF